MADDKCTGIAGSRLIVNGVPNTSIYLVAQTHTRGLYSLPLSEVTPAVDYSVEFYSESRETHRAFVT